LTLQATPPTKPAVPSISVTGKSSCGERFTGTVDITGFAVRDGRLVPLGTVSGTLTDAAGDLVGSVRDAPGAAPVEQHVSIGPLDVDGAVVVLHLDPVALDAGLSGLLGNLLCGLLGGGAAAPPLSAA
jgi:hypothetical protein